MVANTSISWTDHTMNFWVGCEKVGPGCDFCYAEFWSQRAGRDHLWKGALPEVTKTWDDPIRWNRKAANFFAMHGRRQRVFTNSLSDFFDNRVERVVRTKACGVISICTELDWLIVTKRISNVQKMLPADWCDAFYKHVVLLITVCTQAEADRDIPRLIALKERYPWLRIGLSMEPLLERVGLRYEWLAMLDWVIVGGESGTRARPMSAVWASILQKQCAFSGVAFHFKQYGEWLTFEAQSPCFIRSAPGTIIGARVDGVKYKMRDLHAFPGESEIGVRVGKNRTGRLLNGVLHDAFYPEAV